MSDKLIYLDDSFAFVLQVVYSYLCHEQLGTITSFQVTHFVWGTYFTVRESEGSKLLNVYGFYQTLSINNGFTKAQTKPKTNRLNEKTVC